MAPRQTSYWLPPYFRRRRGSQLEWFTACLCRHHLETCVPVQAKENARLPGNREQRSCLSVTFDAILLQMGGSFKVSVSLALWEEVNQLRRGIERFCCLPAKSWKTLQLETNSWLQRCTCSCKHIECYLQSNVSLSLCKMTVSLFMHRFYIFPSVMHNAFKKTAHFLLCSVVSLLLVGPI